jgi:hypothetical protein
MYLQFAQIRGGGGSASLKGKGNPNHIVAFTDIVNDSLYQKKPLD